MSPRVVDTELQHRRNAVRQEDAKVKGIDLIFEETGIRSSTSAQHIPE
jgi:hypothetical protein